MQLDLGGLLDRQIGRFLAPKNSASIIAGLAVRIRRARSVTQQTSGCDELWIVMDRWHRVVDRQCGELFALAREKWLAARPGRREAADA